MEGTVRTFQNEARDLVPNLMKRTIEGVASGLGAKAEFRWFPYMPVVNNSPAFTKIVGDTALELGYEVEAAAQSPAGEDFAYYQMKIPGFFCWDGCERSKRMASSFVYLK